MGIRDNFAGDLRGNTIYTESMQTVEITRLQPDGDDYKLIWGNQQNSVGDVGLPFGKDD